MLGEEGDWRHHRVFSPGSAALAWARPEALVASVVGRWGAKA